ncbi:MAG: large conductance mechanosensitive channel protein MscL [Actinomycetota bacterium]
MRKLLAEFRDFMLRGNVFELAVAFILGIAFNEVIGSLVDDVLMNLIAALFGRPDFGHLTFRVGEGVVRYGSFVTATTDLVLVSLALFFIVKAFNRARAVRGQTAETPTTRDCPYCITNIPVQAARCPACTSDLRPST